MSQYNFITKEVIRTMKENVDVANQHPLIKPDEKAVVEGLEFSRRTCAQKKEVVMTPWLKNLAKKLGDISIDKKTGHSTRLSIDFSEDAKCKSWVIDYCKRCASKFDGAERTEYNEKLPVDDPDHMHVDNWLALKALDDKFWDIKAGQARQREEAFKSYERPTEIDTNKMITMIERSPVMQKTIEWIYKRTPDVRVDKELKNVEDAFMAKDSNVTYKWFKNDKTAIETDSGSTKDTYGKFVLDYTKNLVGTLSPATVWKVWPFNVHTALPRNQRGSGRALEAQSRVMNIVLFTMNGPEMEKVKPMSEFTGLNDDTVLKANLIKLAEFCNANPNYACGNWDQSKFDRHEQEGQINLTQSIRKMHAVGPTSRSVCELRYANLRTSWLINGPANKLVKIYGRTTSGNNDTTLNNTYNNWFVDVLSNLTIDENYYANVLSKAPVYGMYLGDDDCSIHLRTEQSKQIYVDTCKKLGLEVNKDKYAYGCFFLQYRLYKDSDQPDGYAMSYPWPRVVRSMCSKENTKGLGPVGWDQAAYQQLSKLFENPVGLAIAANLIYALDDLHLCLDKTPEWIKAQVQKEDQAALQTKRRAKVTADILYDGNPQDKMFDRDGNMKSDFIKMCQDKIKAVIDPNWFAKLGMKTP